MRYVLLSLVVGVAFGASACKNDDGVGDVGGFEDVCADGDDGASIDLWALTDDGGAETDVVPVDVFVDVAEIIHDSDQGGCGDTLTDLSADEMSEVSPDILQPLLVWENLVPVGRTIGDLVGVASHMYPGSDPDPTRDFMLDQFQSLDGFRMRRALRWDNVEPVQGDWHFENVEPAVTMSVEHGVEILPLLEYCVDWAKTDGETYASCDIDAFANYAGTMAERFCDHAKEYEVWNEENIERFWHKEPDPVRYGDLLTASVGAIRQKCPDARVAFGGMASYDFVELFDTWGYLRDALTNRPELCDTFDIVALHPYTWFQYDPPEHDGWDPSGILLPSQTRMVEIAREILETAGCGEKDIYFTELGWPTYDLSEDDVARYLARSLYLAARDRVDGWYWYKFYDDDPEDSGVRPHENHFGLWAWSGEDGAIRRAKPAWNALVTAVQLMDDFRFARDLGPALGLPNDVYVLVFVNENGGMRLTMWDGRESPDITEEGTDEGGPATTYALSLELPAGTTTTRMWDQLGNEIESPGAGPVINVTLTTSLVYLEIER